MGGPAKLTLLVTPDQNVRMESCFESGTDEQSFHLSYLSFLPSSQRDLALKLVRRDMHKVRPQRGHTREALRNRPAIIPRLAVLHALIHILELRRPLEVLMRIPHMGLACGCLCARLSTRSKDLAVRSELLLAELLFLLADLRLDVGGGIVRFRWDFDDLET